MISWTFRGRKIKAAIEKELSDWELNSEYWGTPERIAQSIKYDLERKLNEEIIKHVERKLDEGLLDKIAEQVIAEFDMKPLYAEALKNKVREVLFKKE